MPWVGKHQEVWVYGNMGQVFLYCFGNVIDYMNEFMRTVTASYTKNVLI